MTKIEIPILPCVACNPMDPLIILSSSGSTGKPKYLVRSHIAAISSTLIIKDAFGLQQGECIAFFSLFGFSLYYQFQVYGALAAGLKVFQYDGKVVLEANAPVMEYIEKYQICLFGAFSSTLQTFLQSGLIKEVDEPEKRFKHLRGFIVTGEPSPPTLKERLGKIFPSAVISD